MLGFGCCPPVSYKKPVDGCCFYRIQMTNVSFCSTSATRKMLILRPTRHANMLPEFVLADDSLQATEYYRAWKETVAPMVVGDQRKQHMKSIV